MIFDATLLERELSTNGFAVLKGILSHQECAQIRALYGRGDLFRSRVVMARHGFGQGEYQYFAYPLPALVDELRESLYAVLAPIANVWNERLGIETRYPERLDQFLEICHRAGQERPTPLLLKYIAGDYNRLHQDLYGATQFPIQGAVLLSKPGSDFTGGEFVLVESAPRAQSRAEVVPLDQGDIVIFAVNTRPIRSSRGFKRVALRHGVTRVRSGDRMTLGLILHDAA
ncbi:MAG: proline hydroxylase [Alphaproteobacteria bacterium]|nr:proline hydroxylase [Alphaproteobacteria bacterium]